MRPVKFSSTIFPEIVLLVVSNALIVSCNREKSAADTIEPVKEYFEKTTGKNVTTPDLKSIEGAKGIILTWKVGGDASGQSVEYSWALAKNTPELMKTLVMFDSARAWNTETYIFLPVSTPALEIHSKVGLSVPKAIYDEDGMNRIRELVISGKAPSGGFVEQFDQFMN